MSAQKKFGMDGYVTVAERIEIFYADYPEGRIITSIIEHDLERGFILMRAEIYRQRDDAQASASGHAYEMRDSSFVNKTSHIENAETSAVGRALAMLGYEIKRGIASREEMQKVERHIAANPPTPGARMDAQQSASGKPDRPNPQTMGKIKELRAEFGVTEPLDYSKLTYQSAEDYAARLVATYGKKR